MIRLICGPPGSGKTSYVTEHATNGDLVIDLDRIRATGVSDATAKKMRAYLEDNASRHTDGDVWIVRTLGDAGERAAFAATVGAQETTVLTTPGDTAKQRVRERDGNTDKYAAIDKWWAAYSPNEGEQTIGESDMGKTENNAQNNEGNNEGNEQKPENGSQNNERAWPADTPVNEMTAEEQAAYWKHHSRKHEGRARDLEDQARKDAEDAAAWRKHQEENKPAEQRATEDAIAKAVADAEARIRKESAGKVFQAQFKAAAALKGVDADAQLAYLDQSRFLTDAGEVDDEKITSFLETLPSGTQEPQGFPNDFGGQPKFEGGSGLDVGRELFKQSRGIQ